jgi:hypothetical protein
LVDITFLDTPEAAEELRLSPRTLERRRLTGDGPPFRKFGRRVVYARQDLHEWAAAQRFSSTSEAQAAQAKSAIKTTKSQPNRFRRTHRRGHVDQHPCSPTTTRGQKMALNIGGNGNFRDIVKFNAKQGKWFHRHGDVETEIEPPTMLVDLANIVTGWLLFLEGSPPNRRWDPSINVAAPQASDSHKRGFAVLCFSKNYFGGVAELSSCSMHLCNAFKDLYAEFENQHGAHSGQLPVVSCTGTTAMNGKFGTNHKPTFQIIKWVDRPADLPDETPADPSEIWKGGSSASSEPPPAPPPGSDTDDLF